MTTASESALTDSPATVLSATQTSLTNCDNEPVRMIGVIQSHAFFFGVTEKDLRVQVVSDNFGDSGLFASGSALGSRLTDMLDGEDFLKEVSFAKNSDYWQLHHNMYFRWRARDRRYDVHGFYSDGLLCFEFEGWDPARFDAAAPELASESQTTFALTSALTRCKAATTVEQLGKVACHEIRKLTGLDRIMLYRFVPPHWHGEVVAEDKIASAHTFMNHRFPASDIPKPARDLYIQNQVRYIADSASEPVKLEPEINPLSRKILDLAESKVRGVSGIHLEYLRNMGVKTSYSVAVIVNGELWGLFACHSSRRIFISQSVRALTQNVAEAVAMTLPLIMDRSELRQRARFSSELLKAFRQLKDVRDPLEVMFRVQPGIFDVFNANGMAYVSSERFATAGMTPVKRDLTELSVWLLNEFRQCGRDVFETSSLSDQNGKWRGISEQASGLLAIRIPERNDAVFMLFRPEVVSSVIWGGNPTKLVSRNYQGTLNPRKSFESWEEKLRNHATPWAAHEIEGMVTLKELMFDALVTKEELIRDLTAKLEN